MAISLRSSGVCVSGSYEMGMKKLRVAAAPSVVLLPLRYEFKGRQVALTDSSSFHGGNSKRQSHSTIHAQRSICVPRSLKWWEKVIKENMREIRSAQELVNSLSNAGDQLVVVGFYSPGCGGCKALHPKICQFAELHPNALFLKVNYEDLRSMCQSLHIHVLPFFRFYRGAQGRVCSFSCTNATIKKFRDALDKHGTDRCSLGPAKGLEESELISLASSGEINFSHPIRSSVAKNLSLAGVAASQLSGSLVWNETFEERKAAVAAATML